MRVKSLLPPVGLALMVALAVPGISYASRGSGTPVETPVESTVQETSAEAVAEEAPAEPAAAEAPAEPVAEEAPTEPVAEEAPAEPVAKKPRPRPVVAPPAAEEPPAEPVVEERPLKMTQHGHIAAPDGDDDRDHARKTDRDDKNAGRCHMDSFEPTKVAKLDNDAEATRAEKVDRNGNGRVCRKEIPGHGRGNTGQGTNIKDDQDR